MKTKIILMGLTICSLFAGACGNCNESEEAGGQLTQSQTFDQVRAGVHLVLSYDASLQGFVGMVHNTTSATIDQVRVEVHLSNGMELGPSPDISLAANETAPVTLPATGEVFVTWVAHAEVGPRGPEVGESGESGCNEAGHVGGESGGG